MRLWEEDGAGDWEALGALAFVEHLEKHLSRVLRPSKPGPKKKDG